MSRLESGDRAQQVLARFLRDEYIDDRRIHPGGDRGVGHCLLRGRETVANPDRNGVATDLGDILPPMREKGSAHPRLTLDQFDPLQRLINLRCEQLISLFIEVGGVVLELGFAFPEFVVPRAALFSLDAILIPRA